MSSEATILPPSPPGILRPESHGLGRLHVVVPLGILAALTALFYVTNLDLSLTRLFYYAGEVSRPGEGWPFRDDWPWWWLYEYGPWAGFFLGGLAAVALGLSLWQRALRPWRRAALFIVLALLIGPGVIVNFTLKNYWGRPRPRQVQEFGGARPFQRVLQPGPAVRNGSFPSGHATMGYFLITPYFVLRRRRPWAARAVLAVGLLYGSLVGLARVVQGQHFTSDVIWAAGFVYFASLALAALLRVEDSVPPVRA